MRPEKTPENPYGLRPRPLSIIDEIASCTGLLVAQAECLADYLNADDEDLIEMAHEEIVRLSRKLQQLRDAAYPTRP